MSASKHDVNRCIERLRNGYLLSESDVAFICRKLITVLLNEPNIIPIRTPITLAGDIHGQYHDLLELFAVGGDIPYTNYLFLGDYVDRGRYSVETISILSCLKLRYPQRITLIRGNHESRQTTMAYGFYAECMSRYKSAETWQYFTNMFDYLPLGALIDENILAIHGGLSPSLHDLDQLRVIDRFNEVPYKGIVCDLIWGDPDDKISGFKTSTRGAGFLFGRDVADKFRHMNNISMIVRAHQLCHDGYDELFDNTVVTVWSAPNYCLSMDMEICTSKGFMSFDAFVAMHHSNNNNDSIHVLGYNPQSKEFVYERPTDFIFNNHELPLIDINDEHNIALSITHNHRIYVNNNNDDDDVYRKVTAESLLTSGNTTRLLAHASNGIASSSSSSSYTTTYLESYGKSYKVNDASSSFDEWVWSLNMSECQIILTGLCVEDGVITTMSMRFRDEICRLCLHAGYSVNNTYRKDTGEWKIMYTNEPRVCKPRIINSKHVYRSQSASTWCVSMPSGFIVVRRRVHDIGGIMHTSRPIIIGNCYRMQNLASIMELDEHHNRYFNIFDASPDARTGLQIK